MKRVQQMTAPSFVLLLPNFPQQVGFDPRVYQIHRIALSHANLILLKVANHRIRFLTKYHLCGQVLTPIFTSWLGQ